MSKDPNANLPALAPRDSSGKEYLPAQAGQSAGGGSYDGLGELLLRERVISLAQLEDASEEVRRTGESISGALSRLGHIEETKLVDFLSRHYGVPSVDLEHLEISPDVVKMIPREVCERQGLMPIDVQGSSIIVAMVDPSNIYAMDDIKFLTGYNVEALVATEQAIKAALERYYKAPDAEDTSLSTYDTVMQGIDGVEFGDGDEASSRAINVEELEKQAELAPVVRLCNLILVDAVKRMASDIHIEPYEKEFRVRYRVDGVLYEIMKPPMKLKNAILSRIKIMSSLDISERRLPQDGRIKLVLSKTREVDFRVSILPCLFGEKAVLRLLDKGNLKLDMTKLGFEPEPLRLFKEAVHSPWGMVLVTGPTGSGKTTTLYSALWELNKVTENISTAEDPVEFNLAGINQCQMNDGVGLNFAAALRSFLRQDPDIIMVGEIRDFETAEIAIKAALTGHLVLSTLHTNDAPATVSRLLNMGVEPFLVTSSLNLILAQRLVRAICSECKTEDVDATDDILRTLQMTEEQITNAVRRKGAGCHVCGGTGFKGRRAIYEVMPLYDELKEAVLQGYSAMELKREAVRLGLVTLRMAANRKFVEGVTSVSEIMRTTRPD